MCKQRYRKRSFARIIINISAAPKQLVRSNLELKVQISQSVDSTNTLFSVIPCPNFYGFCTIFFTDVVDNFISCLFRIVIVSLFFGKVVSVRPRFATFTSSFRSFLSDFQLKIRFEICPKFHEFSLTFTMQ